MKNQTALLAALCAAALSAAAAARDLGEAWHAPRAPDGVQRVRIRCGPNFFDPRVIVVKAGVPVEFSISTTPGLAAHSFTLTGPDRPVQGAADALGPVSRAIAFTPATPGEYPIACRDDAGAADPARQKSKQGTLIVIP